MTPLRVMIAGEGRNELGGWMDEPAYRREAPAPGVVEALLRRVRADGWIIVDALPWSRIRKYRAGRHGDADKRNVLGLVLRALEGGVEVVAFVRDRDGQVDRVHSIEDGLKEARDHFPDGPSIVGGVAVRMLESWIVALGGGHGSEELGKGRLGELLDELGVGAKDTRAMVAVVGDADLEALPGDARSLRAWLDRARAALGA